MATSVFFCLFSGQSALQFFSKNLGFAHRVTDMAQGTYMDASYLIFQHAEQTLFEEGCSKILGKGPNPAQMEWDEAQACEDRMAQFISTMLKNSSHKDVTNLLPKTPILPDKRASHKPPVNFL